MINSGNLMSYSILGQQIPKQIFEEVCTIITNNISSGSKPYDIYFLKNFITTLESLVGSATAFTYLET